MIEASGPRFHFHSIEHLFYCQCRRTSAVFRSCLSCRQFGIYKSFAAMPDCSACRDYPFASQLSRKFMHFRLRFRIEHKLRYSFSVAKIDKNQITVIPI